MFYTKKRATCIENNIHHKKPRKQHCLNFKSTRKQDPDVSPQPLFVIRRTSLLTPKNSARLQTPTRAALSTHEESKRGITSTRGSKQRRRRVSVAVTSFSLPLQRARVAPINVATYTGSARARAARKLIIAKGAGNYNCSWHVRRRDARGGEPRGAEGREGSKCI